MLVHVYFEKANENTSSGMVSFQGSNFTLPKKDKRSQK